MDSTEFERALMEVEKKLDRLRALYDQWLRGYERCEPQVARKDVDRTMQLMRRNIPRNTALRFRFQQLLQRHSLYTTRWGRVARQIEEGTCTIEQQRLSRRKQRQSEPPRSVEAELPGPHTLELDLESNLDMDALIADASESVERTAARSTSQAGSREGGAGKKTFGRPTQDAGGRAHFAPPGGGTGHAGGVSGSAPPGPVLHGASDGRKRASFAKPHAEEREPAEGQGHAPKAAFAKPRADGASEPPPRPAAASFARPRPEGAGSAQGGGSKATFARPGATSPAARGSAGKTPAGDQTSEFGDPQIRQVFDRYVEARKRNNESTSNVRYDALAGRLRKMMPELQKKHRGKDIDFEVVVRDGKVGIKPKVR